MPYDDAPLLSQYDFSAGPNYTDLPWNLGERELAESANVWWDGALKVIPAAGRVMSTALPAVPTSIYSLQVGSTNTLIVTGQNGKIYVKDPGVWTEKVTGLITGAVAWNYDAFVNAIVAASYRAEGLDANVVRYTDGTTYAVLPGSPPNFHFLATHQDYLLGAGHAASRNQIRYSDAAPVAIGSITWPVGNILQLPNDGDRITGLVKYGDVVFIFRERDVWQLSGTTPTDYKLEKTLSDLGCVASQTLVKTDLGIFFWSEGGPTLFSGFKSHLLTRRIRRLMDTVDWTKVHQFVAAYYPTLRHVLVAYTSTSAEFGSGDPDRVLLIDMARVSDKTVGDARLPEAIWPINGDGVNYTIPRYLTSGRSSATSPRDDIFMGFNGASSAGGVAQYQTGTTWNTLVLTPRVRTRAISLADRPGTGRSLEGPPRGTSQVRYVDVVTKPDTNKVTVKYSVDGTTPFVTQSETSYANSNSGFDLKTRRLSGTGGGDFITGRRVQFEVTTNAAVHSFTLVGLDIAMEPGSPRDHQG